MVSYCSICEDIFTGISPESVHSTPCGHVFHDQCLMIWIKKSQTCPYCHSKVTEKQVIKLHFNYSNNIKNQSSSYKMEALAFQNARKDQEIKNLKKEIVKGKEQLILLKKHVKDVEDKVRGHTTVVHKLEENISFLKSECKHSTCFKLEAEELKHKLDNYKSKMQTLNNINKNLEEKFTQRIFKYIELWNAKSKESINTEVIEKLKSEIAYREGENIRLQKKCENLEFLVKPNGNTPRKTKLPTKD